MIRCCRTLSAPSSSFASPRARSFRIVRAIFRPCSRSSRQNMFLAPGRRRPSRHGRALMISRTASTHANRHSRVETNQRGTLMTGARLKHYGWGREGEGMSVEEHKFVVGRYHTKFATDEFDTIAVPRLEDLSLRKPRAEPPASLAAFCTSERYDRAAHSYGKSYPDYVRAMLGDYDCAPDVVAYPRSEADISAVMDWAGAAGASLTPFGGGSSVCGGVEPRIDGIRHKAAVTLDMRNLSKVIEADPVSRAALIEAGTYGPSLENQLKPHGLTLRHFPQSFEYSTLGGWIATRSGGHFASLYTHIDDFVESL